MFILLMYTFFFGLFFGQMVWRLGVLFRMAPENRFNRPLARLGLVLKLGLAQRKMVGRRREWMSGVMHGVIFWGALAIGLREVILLGEGVRQMLAGFFAGAFTTPLPESLPWMGGDGPLGYWYVGVYNVAEGAIAVMILYALFRRLATRPKRLALNWEGIYVLLFIFAIVATDLWFDAVRYNGVMVYGQAFPHLHNPAWGNELDWMPVSEGLAWLLVSDQGAALNGVLYEVLQWAHVAVMLIFLNVLPNTKQFHEITALPNVFFGPLNRPHAPPVWLNLEDEKAWEEERLGVARVEQLTWKQGLDVLSCTECGRCYDVCPTYLTGKPLTLKMVNLAIRAELRKNTGALLKTGKGLGEDLVGGAISPDTLWACTTCRACEEVCPVSIEQVPRILQLRQGQTLMRESYPKELDNAFKGLERNGNPWGLGYDQRAQWAAELNLPVLSQPGEAKHYDVVFWVGCMGSFDKRAQKTARATAALMAKAGVKFAVLGNKEKCTGDLARRAGNEMLFQTLAGENQDTLKQAGAVKVVTACPHCLNALKNEYPQLEHQMEVLHHTEFLEDLVLEGKLSPAPVAGDTGSYTYHDPCYLARYHGQTQAPRDLLAKSTPGLKEMAFTKREAVCCGAGGARMWMEEKLGTRINETRLAQAAQTGANTVVTGCPFCMTMMEDAVKSTGREGNLKVMDVAEVMLNAVEKSVGKS